jgi:hypothetical protein
MFAPRGHLTSAPQFSSIAIMHCQNQSRLPIAIAVAQGVRFTSIVVDHGD